MTEALPDSRHPTSIKVCKGPILTILPQRLLERLVYLPGALVLVYGLWLTLSA
jgi:hypothetical protein